MIRKIVLFTANKSSGIEQMTEEIAEILNKDGIECVCFFPEGTDVSRKELNCRYYSISPYECVFSRNVTEVADKIVKEKSDAVWFTDTPLMSSLVLRKIYKKCKTIITIHDPKSHPSNKSSILLSLYNKYAELNKKKAYNVAQNIVLMSAESLSQYKTMFPQYCDKSVLLPLGAHIPKDDPQKPVEIQDGQDFHLFFGVIDKYKGIENLLDSYNNSQQRIPLVIAGKGKFTDKEKEKIGKSTNVIILNRYITNGEMKWLIPHAKSIVLPYIEASQSGVLPIAYSYGVPVIVSDLPGLTQYVENEKTGFVCKNIKEMTDALNILSSNDNYDLRENTLHYYKTQLDWKQNLRKLLLIFGEGK
ncbi:glycosyltransferase [Clostridiales bacterium FE2011]|nr:glycosyltransferase [Clostridiales bacterium FE2011]